MKNIILLYSYGFSNPGDYAITPGTINAIRNTNSDTFITVVSLHREKSEIYEKTKILLEQKFNNLKVIPNDIYLSNKKRTLLEKVIFIFSLVFFNRKLVSKTKSHVIKEIVKADLLVFNGGHIFFWDKLMGEKMHIVKMYFFMALLAKKQKVNYGIFANSFGPYEFNKLSMAKLMFNIFFNGAKFITARDTHSINELNKLSIKTKVQNVLDPAFYITDEEPVKADEFIRNNNLNENEFVCVSFRLSNRGSIIGLPNDRFQKYRNSLSKMVEHILLNSNYPVLFIIQVKKDEEDMKMVLNNVKVDYERERIIFVNGDNAGFLRSLYKKSKLLIAMRFHSLIFALSKATPVVGISYREIGPKIKGLMMQFNCDNCFISLEHFNTEKQNIIEEILNNKEEYSENLREVLAENMTKSNEIFKEIFN